MKSRILLSLVSVLLACVMTASAADEPIKSVEAAREQLEEEPMNTMARLEESPLKVRKGMVSDLMKIFTGKEETRKYQKIAGNILEKTAQDAPKAVVPFFVKELKQAREKGRSQLQIRLIHRIGEFGEAGKKAVPELIKFLKSGEESVQHWVLQALQNIGPAADKALPQLTERSTHVDPLMRYRVLKTMKAVATGKKLAKAVKPVLQSDYAQTRMTAIDIVQEVGAKARTTVPLLIELLNKEQVDTATRERAIAALGAVGSQKAQPALIDLLKAEKTPERLKMASASALRSMDKPAPKALDPLMKLPKDADSEQKKIIDKAIKSIKKTNTAPQVEDVNLTCTEGDTVSIELPMTDKDDIQAGTRIRVVEKPEKGNLTQEGPRTVAYESEYGHPGAYTLKWKGSDGRDESAVAKAAIQVKPDKEAPELRSAYALENGTQVKVMFDEPVTAKTAGEPGNYRIDGAEVKKAALVEANRVTLTTTELEKGKSHQLVISGIADRSKAGNKIKEATFEVRYGKPFLDFEAYEHGATPMKIPGWSAGKDWGICHVDAKTFAGKKQGNVFYMDVNSGINWQDVLTRTFNPVLQGRYQFEYKYWEPGGNHTGHLWLRGTDGKPLIGVGTNNPQWRVVIGDKGQVVVNEYVGRDYEHWIQVTLQVDTARNRARVTFNDTEDDDKKSYGWFDLPEMDGIGSMGIGPDNVWYVDDIRIRQWRPKE